jgi:hypothetical protein
LKLTEDRPLCAKFSVAGMLRAFPGGVHGGSQALAYQLRQLGDVGGDAPGLVAGEQLGRRAPSGGS